MRRKAEKGADAETSANNGAALRRSEQTSNETSTGPSTAHGAVRIKVVEVRRGLLDVYAASLEEIEVAFSAAVEDNPKLRALGPEFVAMLRAAQDPRAAFAGPTGWWEDGASQPPEVQARVWLASAGARVVIGEPRDSASRGQGARQQPEERLHIRAHARTPAVYLDGTDAALAAEEMVTPLALAFDPRRGAAHLVELRSGPNAGLATNLATGSLAPALLGAAQGLGTTAFPALVPPRAVGPKGAKRSGKDKRAEEGTNEARTTEPPDLFGAVRRGGFGVYPLPPTREGTSEQIASLLRFAKALDHFYLADAGPLFSAAGMARRRPLAEGSPFIVSTAPVAQTPEPDRGPHPAPLHDERGERLEYLLRQLAKTEPIAVDSPSYWAHQSTPLADLFRIGAMQAYLLVLTEGRESPGVEAVLEQSRIARLRADKAAALRDEDARRVAFARLLMLVLEDKLGAKRAAEVVAASQLRAGAPMRPRVMPGSALGPVAGVRLVDEPNALLAELSAREREIVQTEVENRREAWRAHVGNKCPHLRLVRRLRYAPTVDAAADVLAEVERWASTDGKDTKRAPRGGHPPGAQNPAAADTWILCTNCGFRLLCPHVRVRIRLEAKRAPYSEMRSRLLPFAQREGRGGRGRDRDQDGYTYFCRICSERLGELVDEDRAGAVLGMYGDLDSGIRAAIWGEALAAAKFVHFPVPTDGRAFARIAADAIYPLLMQAEELLAGRARARRAAKAVEVAPGELDPRTRVYAVVFVYAYILALIRSSQVAPEPLGFEGVRPGAKISAYVDAILRHILQEKKGVLSQLPEQTALAEYLLARFREASQALQNAGEGGLLYTAKPEEEFANQITQLDPVYQYALAAAKVLGVLPLGRASTPAAAKTEFEHVMGQPLPDLVKNARQSARDPEVAQMFAGRLITAIQPGKTINQLYKDPRVNLYARMAEPPPRDAKKYAHFQALVDEAARVGVSGGRKNEATRPAHPAQPERQKREAPKKAARTTEPSEAARGALWPRPPVIREDGDTSADYGYYHASFELFWRATVQMRNADEEAALRRDLAKVRGGEVLLLREKAYGGQQTLHNSGSTRTDRFERLALPVTYLYDEDGLKHVWSAYVFSNGDTELEIRKDDAEAAMKAVYTAVREGRLTGFRLLDIQCTVCGVRQSEFEKLDADKAAQAVANAADISMFFSFYAVRCPADGLHEFRGAQDAAACAKCGAPEALLAGFRTKKYAAAAAEYYTKFLNKFRQEQTEILYTGDGLPAQEVEGPSPAASKTDGTGTAVDLAALIRPVAPITWRRNYDTVLRLADFAGIAPVLIDAIGATERRTYSDVKQGRGLEPMASAEDPRLSGAEAEHRLLVADYARLRNMLAAAPEKLAPSVRDLLGEAGVQPHEFGALQKTLPDPPPYDFATFAALRGGNPADAVAYLIEGICALLLRILGPGEPSGDKSSPQFAKFRELYARRGLDLVLRNGRLLSQPSAFNFALPSDVAEDRADDQDDVGDVGEDVLAALDTAGGEDGANNPFTTEGMDYEYDANVEPN